MRLLFTVSAIALLSCTALATDVAPKSAKPAKQQQAQAESKKPQEAPSADKPKPSPEMKRLARMIAGRWQVEEKYEVTPLTPQGGEGKGTNTVHRGPGGLSLISNYSSNGTMGEYQGAGVTTWSPEDGSYKQFWVDNGSPGGELWIGKADGDSLVFTTTQKMGEQTIHWRETYSGFSNDAFTVTFDMGPSEAELKRCMTFKFTRMARQSAGERRHGMGMHGRPTSDGWGGPRADATQR